MAAGFSRWPMLKNSDFWISRFDIWLQHGLLHRPRLKNYSNRTNIDTFRAKSVWRPFCFFTWLTCFFEKVHAKEHSCQIWCLYHKVKYWPLFFKLAAPLLLSKAYLQLSSFSSTCSLLSLQITMSSANIMVHGASSLMSSVILSITIANKQGLKADHWCSPTFTSNPSVTPTAHLTAVVLPSYISCTILTYFSANPDFLMQYDSHDYTGIFHPSQLFLCFVHQWQSYPSWDVDSEGLGIILESNIFVRTLDIANAMEEIWVFCTIVDRALARLHSADQMQLIYRWVSQ